MTDHLYRDIRFQPGDLVQFTRAARLQCDPAITDEECRGEVVRSVGSLMVTVRFDDGEIVTFPANRFEKLN